MITHADNPDYFWMLILTHHELHHIKVFVCVVITLSVTFEITSITHNVLYFPMPRLSQFYVHERCQLSLILREMTEMKEGDTTFVIILV